MIIDGKLIAAVFSQKGTKHQSFFPIQRKFVWK